MRVLPRARVDHWLDGEAVSRLHDELGLVARIVRDVGRAVEALADAVTAVGLVHLEAVLGLGLGLGLGVGLGG